jgi:N-glycosylase/DNA lyase
MPLHALSRIHGMVERLCSSHGTLLLPAADGTVKEEPQQRGSNGEPLDPLTPPVLASSCGEADGQELRERSMLLPLQPAVQLALEPPQPLLPASEHAFYAFPTLEQLKAATEDELRAAGFGYRARFIVGAVAALRDMPQGGAAWLQGLRKEPYAAAHEALCALPGIGPKVAACICLFALDKHDAIPVDTHVWALATRHYARHLAGKALTPKLHGAVQEAFVNRFGPYAGWAHNTLFVAEVASRRGALPDGAAAAPGGVRRGRRSSDASDVEVEIGKDEVSHNASTPAAECTTPAASRRRARKRSARFTDYVATSDVSDLATTSDSDS